MRELPPGSPVLPLYLSQETRQILLKDRELCCRPRMYVWTTAIVFILWFTAMNTYWSMMFERKGVAKVQLANGDIIAIPVEDMKAVLPDGAELMTPQGVGKVLGHKDVRL